MSRRLGRACWTAAIEAEGTALTAATGVHPGPAGGGGWKFLASGGQGRRLVQPVELEGGVDGGPCPAPAATASRSSAPRPAFPAGTPSSSTAVRRHRPVHRRPGAHSHAAVAVPRQRGGARRRSPPDRTCSRCGASAGRQPGTAELRHHGWTSSSLSRRRRTASRRCIPRRRYRTGRRLDARLGREPRCRHPRRRRPCRPVRQRVRRPDTTTSSSSGLSAAATDCRWT